MAYNIINTKRFESQPINFQDAFQQGLNTYIKANEAKYAPKKSEMDLAKSQAELDLAPYRRRLLEAQTAKARSAPNLTGKMGQLFTLRNSLPEGSQDRALVDEAIKNAAAGSAGLNFNIDPATGAINLSQGGSSRGGPQAQLVTDKDGNKVLVQKPTTPVATGQQKLDLANVVRQHMAENTEQPYLGTGSNIELGFDRYSYANEKDPKKKKAIGDKLVKAATAVMLAPEYAGLQLQAQGTPSSKFAIKDQERAIKQGWPESIDLIVNNLPPELQAQAKKEHAKTLQKLKELREKHFASGLPIKLDSSDQSDARDLSKMSDDELRKIAGGG